MAKSIKSIALVCAVLIALGIIYESSLRKISSGGKEWLRRHTTDFCEPGYRLHSEHCWHCDNGETYFVYVFETTPMHRGFSPGVQLLLESANHEPLHRLNIKSSHKLMNTALLESLTPTRLELVFRVDEPAPDLFCYYWKVEGNRLLRADFTTI